MRIKQSVIHPLKSDVVLKAKLVSAFKNHYGTVERWLNDNKEDGPLTTAKAMGVIKEHTKLDEDAILEKRNSSSKVRSAVHHPK
ncbi:MAG: hypothetical protein ACTHJ5_13705 [Ilyomonas sp.]